MVERSWVEKSWVEMLCKGLYGEMLKQYFQANVTLYPFLLWDLQIGSDQPLTWLKISQSKIFHDTEIILGPKMLPKKLVLFTSSFFQMGFLILDNCDRGRQIEMMTLNDAEKRIEHCQEELNSKNG